MKKNCILVYFLSLILLFLLVDVNSFAAVKTYTHSLKQPYVKSQLPEDARIEAVSIAGLKVLEKAAIYLQNMPMIKKNNVDKNIILALAVKIFKVKIVSEKKYSEKNETGIQISVKIDTDTSTLERKIKYLSYDKELIVKYRSSLKIEKRILGRIEVLRKEDLKSQYSPSNSTEKNRLKKEFKKESQKLIAVSLYNQAASLWDQMKYRDPEKALNYLGKAVQRDPDFAEAYNERGIIWYSKKKYNRALAAYNRAIDINPGYAAAYYNRAITWRRSEKPEKAIADFSKAIDSNPKYLAAYNNRGVIYKEKGEYDKAIADYTMAVKVNPKYFIAYINRARAWKEKNRYDKAVADYQKAIEIFPENAAAYNGLAWIFATCPDSLYRNGTEAVVLAKKAVKLVPKNANFLDTMAAAYAESGDFKMAVKTERKALKLSGNNKEYQKIVNAYKQGKTYIEYQKSLKN